MTEQDAEMLELVRPACHATDRDWALALDDDLFVAQDRLGEAEAALDAVTRALVGWQRYVAEMEAQNATTTSEGNEQ